jgi:hypothetical protein
LVTQVEFLKRALEVLDALQLPYAIVGSWASGFWGDPRMTRDIDVVVRIGDQHISQLLACFPAPEFYASRPAMEEAIRMDGQFNIIHPTSGNKIDFMIAKTSAWGDAQLARRRRVGIVPGRQGYIAAPEDVILGKLLYYREGGSDRHLSDIAGILAKSGAAVDLSYVQTMAEQLSVGEEWRVVLSALSK